MTLHTKWYISEAKEWQWYETGTIVSPPQTWDVYIHRHVNEAEDFHRAIDEIHSNCDWLDGENCVTERVVGQLDATEWTQTLISGGANDVEAKLRAVYEWRFPK